MRETPLSTCEKEFILKIIADKKRIDGRQTYDYRKIRISFGIDRGCCQVQIGETRVLAQVSCEITAPKPNRPTDGILFINTELSPMASPSFELGRQSEFGVELTRLLERCLKESRCIDTESLCIIAGHKVWSIRVDIHALNHDGNLLDCASIAAITAMSHFRRPDVTVDGEEVTVHPPEDHDVVPLSIHHMPICVSFAFFEQGKFLLVDPHMKEEKVMDGKMVIGMNKHREICMLQITGQMFLLKDQVLRCSNVAVVKVTEITELIQKALANDKTERESGGKFGFAESVDTCKITVYQKEAQDIDMKNSDEIKSEEENMDISNKENGSDDGVKVSVLGKGLGVIGEGGANTWEVDEDMQEELHQEVQTGDRNKPQKSKVGKRVEKFLTKARKEKDPLSSDDSEEDCVVVLHEVEGSSQRSQRKTKDTKGQIDLTGSDVIDLTDSPKSDKPVPVEKNRKNKKKRK